jgi:hypothetical protein
VPTESVPTTAATTTAMAHLVSMIIPFSAALNKRMFSHQMSARECLLANQNAGLG